MPGHLVLKRRCVPSQHDSEARPGCIKSRDTTYTWRSRQTKANKHGTRTAFKAPASEEYGFVAFHDSDDELGDRIQPMCFLPQSRSAQWTVRHSGTCGPLTHSSHPYTICL